MIVLPGSPIPTTESTMHCGSLSFNHLIRWFLLFPLILKLQEIKNYLKQFSWKRIDGGMDMFWSCLLNLFFSHIYHFWQWQCNFLHVFVYGNEWSFFPILELRCFNDMISVIITMLPLKHPQFWGSFLLLSHYKIWL